MTSGGCPSAATKFANLPAEEKYALYHPKDIGRQEKQNQLYETINNRG